MLPGTLWGGSLTYHQPPRGAGYRVNRDAVLLAEFAAVGPRAATAVDLGAGAGAVGLGLLLLDAARTVHLVEIDPEAMRFARMNVEANGYASRARAVEGDVVRSTRALRGSASLVVCNPPFVEPGRGRTSPNAARDRGRKGALLPFVRAARNVAGRRARVCFVYPAAQALHLFGLMSKSGLEPKRICMVHATPHEPARIVLVEARPGKPGGLVIETPIFERKLG